MQHPYHAVAKSGDRQGKTPVNTGDWAGDTECRHRGDTPVLGDSAHNRRKACQTPPTTGETPDDDPMTKEPAAARACLSPDVVTGAPRHGGKV